MAAPGRARNDLSAYVQTAVGTVLPLAISAVIARLASRRIQRTRLNASDYLILAGLVGVIVFSGLTLGSLKVGFGKHVETISKEDLENFLKIFYVAEMFYVFDITMIKFSILLLYTSLFPGKAFGIVAKIIALLVSGWAIACLLGAIFTCTPINGFWDHTIPSKCLNSSRFFIGNSVPNIATDIAILCLPIREVWRLQISTRSKVAVSGFFLTGGFVIVASTFRLALIFHEDFSDPTWGIVTIFTWSNIELNIGVVSACLPTLRPLLQKVWPSYIISRTSKIRSPSTSDKQRRLKDGSTFRNLHSKPGDEFHRLKDTNLPSLSIATASRDSDPEHGGSLGVRNPQSILLQPTLAER